MGEKHTYFNRDLSWLSFNKRILQEAGNPDVPLYERIKFLAIYSSNLDEFFIVRVASIRSIISIDKKKIYKRLSDDPRVVLDSILREVHVQQEEFGRIKREVTIPELKKHGIVLYRDEQPLNDHNDAINHYFRSRILSYLQPHILTGKKTRKVFLENKQLYFVIDLVNQLNESEYALVNIPSNFLDRFVKLPTINKLHYFIIIDDIIRENLDFLFPNYKIQGCYSIKLNRDAELNIEDEYSGDLVKKIQKQIAKRNLGVPSRFLYDATMSVEMAEYLKGRFDLVDDDMVPGGRYHNMNDLFGLKNPLSPELEYDYKSPLKIKGIERYKSIFDAIDKSDQLMHFPYQSYDYVLRFFNEAALDPEVKQIKATFYRIAPESFICNALISAAINGKKVTVFVELKARFDEQNNLKWAEKMKAAGVKIIYSMPGLKVHAKVAVITRRNSEGKKVNYGYFGTGNFNEKTATIYADQALLSTNEKLTTELDQLFLFLEKQETPNFETLLVSQFNIIDRFESLIDREIENAKAGKKALIIIKINNLQHQGMISKLYQASEAGVKIDMIVRSICCLIPGVKGMSDNINVHRIVDQYLEHSRAFYFYNNGDDELYQGSADWMNRNLERRIEVVFPVLKREFKEQILKMLELQLNDNIKGVMLDVELNNVPVEGKSKVRSQIDFYEYLGSIE
ncbi:polyphosphate kinase 1 [Fulvivirga lutimaris]|uniref:polyphosphate kinase 1 n=1 Tax=Fulvivirga lutimaris TaxID=1819566 RepID=UPI0012BC456D|nr:polyphosphate kinase 1 [Fulvivirga lutimaris]MTI38805.1 polyphosphate kinase 1 [Fulvivirga lutimaris]